MTANLEDALDILPGNTLVLLVFRTLQQHLIARRTEQFVEVFQLRAGNIAFFVQGKIRMLLAEILQRLLCRIDSFKLLARLSSEWRGTSLQRPGSARE